MTEVETYLVSTAFMMTAGVGIGHGSGVMGKSQSGELDETNTGAMPLLGLIALVLCAIYGFLWLRLIDGPRFVWVPAVVLTILAVGFGSRTVNPRNRELRPWKLTLWSAAIVVAGYYWIAPSASE